MTEQRVLELGQKIVARNDRIFHFADQEPFVLWKKNQVLEVKGFFLPGEGWPVEVMVALDESNHENIPMPIFVTEFDVQSESVH